MCVGGAGRPLPVVERVGTALGLLWVIEVPLGPGVHGPPLSPSRPIPQPLHNFPQNQAAGLATQLNEAPTLNSNPVSVENWLPWKRPWDRAGWEGKRRGRPSCRGHSASAAASPSRAGVTLAGRRVGGGSPGPAPHPPPAHGPPQRTASCHEGRRTDGDSGAEELVPHARMPVRRGSSPPRSSGGGGSPGPGVRV